MRPFPLLMAMAVAVGTSFGSMCTGQDSGLALRVMTYNIRFGTANDGENHWDRRKEWLVETIRTFAPDLLGTQETLGFQRDYLAEMLPEFEAFGVGRDDGREKGEMVALFYRKDRFERIDGGHFWLSETPDVPGSKSWDSSLPRHVTWVKLQDRKRTDARPLLYLNTHFDHLGRQARLQSAKLLRDRAFSLAKDGPVVITGDFNTAEASEPYRELLAAVDGSSVRLVDAYRSAHPMPSPDEGTFSGFRASDIRGPRIDWILVSRDWQVTKAGIDRTSRDGRTPSDHFAVTAVLQDDENN